MEVWNGPAVGSRCRAGRGGRNYSEAGLSGEGDRDVAAIEVGAAAVEFGEKVSRCGRGVDLDF